MKLKLQTITTGHLDIASAVSWNCASDIFTCGDDQTLQRWNTQGHNVGKVCALESSISDLHCCPLSTKKQSGSPELFAVACTDGSIKLIHSNGKVEKTAEAHSGAALCVRWSPDGNALASSGEDGHVKIWSKAGMLRSTLLEAEVPVYCLAWGGGSATQLLVCSGSHVSIRLLQGVASGPVAAGSSISSMAAPNTSAGISSIDSAAVSWVAHDGAVLKADWNPITGLIVTGGEDCRYKVWDAFGRLLYSSSPWANSITSVAWSPAGTVFAAGSHNCLALCDKQGWSYSQVRHTAGSLLGLCWAPDATRIAAAGASGALVIAAVLEVTTEDGRFVATLVDQNVISINDLATETSERLEFRDAVVKLSIGFGRLIVCTSSHCHVYSTTNFNTPHIFDLKEQPQLVLQCARNFVLLDATAGLQVFTYDGRQVCAFRPQGLSPDGISRQLVSLSSDTLAAAVGCSVRCYETAQGRPVGEPLSHGLEVKAVCLSQAGVATDRLLALLDSNGDLYLVRHLTTGMAGLMSPAPIAAAAAAGSTRLPGGSGKASTVAGVIAVGGLVSQGAANQQQQRGRMVKLAGNVAGVPVWHDSAPLLAAVVDSQLVVWYHPAAAFLDQDLLQATRCVVSTDSLGAGASLELFTGSRITLRQADGAQLFVGVPPQPLMVHELVRQGAWDKAVRLARFSHDPAVWACLAALAMAAGELATAEAAFAAIGAVDKLQYVLHLKSLAGAGASVAAAGSDPLVAAELLLYAGHPDQAEARLLQAGLVYRAVKMHVRLHNWQRALELAVKHNQHVDTVLYYRQRYLSTLGQPETLPAFKTRTDGVVLDAAAIKAAIQQDKAAEAQQRAAASRGKA